ncbi:uncharacterized protein LOC114328638 [Diabrotica virgifera virgifera]|uniref:Uncharacterized protein LOC114328638 n=1 Tax=Diabrotica virgifera virgifera TaxID=50390 RepID=A0A6P7FCJ8_DIAVI|nr:uncharacterized protein LOC114328638 [Diabrotica virgifera virgifera]
MYYSVILLFLGVLFSHGECLSDEMKAKIMDIAKQCNAATGIDDQVVAQALAGNFPTDDKFKKFVLCFGKMIGFLDEEGNPNIAAISEAMKMNFGDQMSTDVIMGCAKKESTPEDTAYNVFKCSFKVIHM